MWYSKDHGKDGVTATNEDELREALATFYTDEYYMDIVNIVGTVDGQDFLLDIGAANREGIAALRYAGHDVHYSKGEPTDYDVLEFAYYGTPHEFPTDAAVPWAKAVDAALAFLHRPDRLPDCVDWQLKSES
ncbi:Imm1 family immunity protein [Stackebrandtia soli]|uniref:Imm1 family immunity protein n=1 Tax=Stackebrandtia soli TaxID=1892856 RepID=UPI0039E9EE50